MAPADIYALITNALLAVLTAAGPVMAMALAIGLVIGFVQALTQIQEMTLTFVPKIVIIFLGVSATLPFIFSVLSDFTDNLFDLMIAGSL